ncbi:hypothetical protein IW262DRAFT_501647 [Armillaria fumosa]|nr:hypothetical protein IW262DRAFT_501647 [Armillaria fumosa]
MWSMMTMTVTVMMVRAKDPEHAVVPERVRRTRDAVFEYIWRSFQHRTTTIDGPQSCCRNDDRRTTAFNPDIIPAFTES